MSWLARSLTNSLRLDPDGDYQDDEQNDVAATISPRNHNQHQRQLHYPQQQQQHQHHHQHDLESEQEEEEEEEEEEESQGRGVKEDLNEIKQTLTRQLWGMASFLAPPPSTNNLNSHSHPSSPEPHRTRSHPDSNQSEPSGNDQQEVEEDTAIWPISDIEDPDMSGRGPNLVHVGSGSELETEECDFERAVGITEEVFAFASNIAMHPETWLDFPIEEEEDTDVFDMSEAQREHALAIERLAPRLAALRIELCPCHMSESYFWKVYFVLLHSRLNKQDAEILSTPQVMAARAMWMQELQKQMKPEFELSGRSTIYSRDTAQHDNFAPSLLDGAYSDDKPLETRGYEMATLSMTADYETEKHTVEISETHFIDKSVIEEKPMIKTEDKYLKSGRASQIILQNYEDDDDDWPEEDSDLGGYGGTTIPVVNEEDISFSDLEDDDFGIKPVGSNTGSIQTT